MPSAKLAEADFDVMTAEPHHTGSPYEIKLADYVADTSSRSGSKPPIRVRRAAPWPGERRIDIVAPDQIKLQVEEEKIRGDQWADKPGILPAYNAYSPSGDVTGEIVYVNYGIPADYETLEKLGIDVKGKIVLARYGGSWRGIKPKVAAEHGAIACIIYSDPHEDGYFQGDVYPDGPFRGWGMIQRGSVMDMPRYPGDPSTPDRPSKPGVERLPMDKIETFAPIPVQPMSYRDGLELLKRLKGPVAPEAWRGALPLTYHIGPGPAKIVAYAGLGRTPFGADIPAALAIRIMTGEPDLHGLQGPLRELVEHALAEEPGGPPDRARARGRPSRDRFGATRPPGGLRRAAGGPRCRRDRAEPTDAVDRRGGRLTADCGSARLSRLQR